MTRLESVWGAIRRAPPIVVDAGLAAGVILITILELAWWIPARDPTTHAKVVDYVLMTASAAVLTVRRRNRLGAWVVSRACALPIALHVVYGEDIGTHILAAIMVYTIAERCSLRVAVPGLLAEYALITANVFVSPITGQIVFQGFYYFGFLSAFVFFAGRAQRYRQGLTADLIAQTKVIRDEQELLAAQASAVERRRIARDLNSLVIEGIERMAADTAAARLELAANSGGASVAIEGIEATGRRTLEDMGRVLSLMDVDEGSEPASVSTTSPKATS